MTIRTLTDYREEIAMRARQHRGRVFDTPATKAVRVYAHALPSKKREAAAKIDALFA